MTCCCCSINISQLKFLTMNFWISATFCLKKERSWINEIIRWSEKTLWILNSTTRIYLYNFHLLSFKFLAGSIYYMQRNANEHWKCKIISLYLKLNSEVCKSLVVTITRPLLKIAATSRFEICILSDTIDTSIGLHTLE